MCIIVVHMCIIGIHIYMRFSEIAYKLGDRVEAHTVR